MATTVESLLEQILKLTPEQRLAVMDAIWQSLGDMPPAKPSEAEMAEIQRRWAEYEADPSIAIPWDQAREQIRAEVARRRALRESQLHDA